MEWKEKMYLCFDLKCGPLNCAFKGGDEIDVLEFVQRKLRRVLIKTQCFACGV